MLLWDTIETQNNLFSATDKRFIAYIRSNPNIIYMSITEVIEESGISYGSIIRFTKKVGCSGFQDFKIRLAGENSQLETNDKKSDEEISFVDNFHQTTEKQLTITSRNIDENILIDITKRFINARQIMVIGAGGSHPMVEELVYRLVRLGFNNVSHEQDEHYQAYRVSMLEPSDLLIVFSFSGSTKSILEIVKLAKESEVQVVAFTNHLKSPLSDLVDISLIAASHVPALKAELGTKIPFYYLIELLSQYIYKESEYAKKALHRTYEVVADKQI